MTITLYDAPKSGHCHRVRLAASVMEIDLDLVQVSEMEGQRQGKDYLAINPFGQVPSLVDGDLIIRDSLAIIQYLERTYAPEGEWMPKDPILRTEVDQWFGIAAGVLFRGPNTARLIRLFKVDGDYEAALRVSSVLFQFMNAHLQNRKWLVGEQPTLADIACYSYIAVADEGDLDLSGHDNIRTWLDSVQALNGFVDIPRSR